jgi:hypothetical protein
MPEPAESLLTIGEIAAAARHLAKDPFAFSERCRHWARLGLLQAVKQVGEGAGRHALFPETETYMAAVVTALAETGLHPAGSRPVGDAQSVARQALTTWLAEKAKRRRPQAMRLEISFYPGGGRDIAVLRGRQKPTRTGEKAAALKAREFDPTARPITVITLNLDSLFTSVLEAAEANSVSRIGGAPVTASKRG